MNHFLVEMSLAVVIGGIFILYSIRKGLPEGLTLLAAFSGLTSAGLGFYRLMDPSPIREISYAVDAALFVFGVGFTIFSAVVMHKWTSAESNPELNS